ncbi:hypothetical protein ABIE00_002899 [Arthrobacter sp. OAP107]
MRNVAPIVRNAIQATFPKITITRAKTRKTIPSGRNAALPGLPARLSGFDVDFLSPFIYATLPIRKEVQ